MGTPTMMHQPAPPPYSAPQQTPIGWAINNIPTEHSAGNKKSCLIILKRISISFSLYSLF
jgi:hypothetical protein